jgi:hypothetical protein
MSNERDVTINFFIVFKFTSYKLISKNLLFNFYGLYFLRESILIERRRYYVLA